MEMLLDVLAMMMGFAAVMALFSLVVTALVQATQSAVTLRARNLEQGLGPLLRVLQPKQATKPAVVMAKLRDTLPIQGEPTAATKEELTRAIRDATNQDIAIAEDTFKRFEQALSSRFRLWTKWIGFGWGFVVAFYFQLSAIDLASTLRTDPAFRDKAAALGEELAKRPTPKPVDDYSTVSAVAIERLGDKYPDLRRRLEEVSGRSKTKAGSVSELSLVLADLEPRELGTVVADYGRLLDGAEVDQANADMKEGEKARQKLAGLNLEPWSKGMAFYLDDPGLRIDRIIGVLITAILLTLGAPFWFEKLKDLSGLKDVFANPRRKPEATQ